MARFVFPACTSLHNRVHRRGKPDRRIADRPDDRPDGDADHPGGQVKETNLPRGCRIGDGNLAGYRGCFDPLNDSGGQVGRDAPGQVDGGYLEAGANGDCQALDMGYGSQSDGGGREKKEQQDEHRQDG